MSTLKVGQQVRVKISIPVELLKVFHSACPGPEDWLSRHECSKYSFLGRIVTITAISSDGWVRIKLKNAQIIVREEWLEPISEFRSGEYIQSKITGNCYLLTEGASISNNGFLMPEEVPYALVNKITKCKYNSWKANQAMHNLGVQNPYPRYVSQPLKEPTMKPDYSPFATYKNEGGWTVKQDEPKNWTVLESSGSWWGRYTYDKALEEAKRMSLNSPKSTFYVGQIRDMVKTVTETKTTVSPYKPVGE